MRMGLEGRDKIIVNSGVDVGERNRTSGASVLGLLILIAERSCDGFWAMFANEMSSEAREGGQVTATDGTQ